MEIARRNNIQYSSIGNNTCTGDNTVIVASNIGKYCTISWNCSIGGGEHFIHSLSLTRASRIFNEKRTEDFYTKPLNIGNDVWIAAGAHILRGVTIGDGAVIGAGAVVKKDVPPYAMVVGVPGKVIGYRFSDSVIEKLLSIKWWNFSEEKLNKCKWCFYGDLNDERISFLENLSRSNF